MCRWPKIVLLPDQQAREHLMERLLSRNSRGMLQDVVSLYSGSAVQEHFQLTLLLNGLGHIFASLVYAPMADRFGRCIVKTPHASRAVATAFIAFHLLLWLGRDTCIRF